MKPEEAATIVTMLAGVTSTRLLTQEIEIWEEQIRPLDAHLATQTVYYGRNTWNRFPSWAKFREVYYMLKRQMDAATIEQPEPVPPAGRRGVEAPEWVWVWNWARFRRAPRNLRPFPQERGSADDALLMSQEEYEKLRDEWIAAGRPKAQRPLPTMVTKEV